MDTTPTGIPIIPCLGCGRRHPENRNHCGQCGMPSAFLSENGICINCFIYGHDAPSKTEGQTNDSL